MLLPVFISNLIGLGSGVATSWLQLIAKAKILMTKNAISNPKPATRNPQPASNLQLILSTPIIRHSHQLRCKLCHYIHQFLLGCHHLMNVFVRHWCFV